MGAAAAGPVTDQQFLSARLAVCVCACCPGWNLINEPRCYRCGAALQRWTAEMASFVKSLDSNHLLTLGSEGFYPAGSPQVRC